MFYKKKEKERKGRERKRKEIQLNIHGAKHSSQTNEFVKKNLLV